MDLDEKGRAYRNALTFILPDENFPNNVFAGRWDKFLFFPSDNIFDRGFVAALHQILIAENSYACALVNLDDKLPASNEPPAIYLGRKTAADDYINSLRNGAPIGWLFRMDAYACTSEKGGWCIYCEKQNEVAAIAIRSLGDLEKFESAIALLNAAPINVKVKRSGDFPFGDLTLDWRSALLEHYS